MGFQFHQTDYRHYAPETANTLQGFLPFLVTAGLAAGASYFKALRPVLIAGGGYLAAYYAGLGNVIAVGGSLSAGAADWFYSAHQVTKSIPVIGNTLHAKLDRITHPFPHQRARRKLKAALDKLDI